MKKREKLKRAERLEIAILLEKTQYSAAQFLEQVVNECPYTIEVWYTDLDREWEGNPETHAPMKICSENKIELRIVNNARDSYK